MDIAARDLDKDLITQAAAWMARLLADDVSENDHQAVAQWRAADPRHERAWQAIQQVSGKFAALPAEAGGAAVLERASQTRLGRRQFLQWAGAGGAAVVLSWYGASRLSVGADYRSGVGEIATIDLDDGTRLILNTDSAADVRFSAVERRIVLQRGEILITTGRELPRRDFVVDTRAGRIIALGTEFSVRQFDDRVAVEVVEGQVRIEPVSGAAAVQIGAGEQVDFTAVAAGTPEAAASRPAAWRDGVLVTESMRLGDFIAELSRYRRGFTVCDEQVADLRVSGVFSLTDTDRALASLASSLPVSVSYRTRYWVTVVPRAGT